MWKIPSITGEIVRGSKLSFPGINRTNNAGTTQDVENSNNKGNLLVSSKASLPPSLNILNTLLVISQEIEACGSSFSPITSF